MSTSVGRIARSYLNPGVERLADADNVFAQFLDRHRIPAEEFLEVEPLDAFLLARLYVGDFASHRELRPQERRRLAEIASIWLGRRVPVDEIFGHASARPWARKAAVARHAETAEEAAN